jgi:MSHA biogenesis protein MshK
VAGGVVRCSILLAALTGMGAASPALAQALRDPTRPPFASARGSESAVTKTGWTLQSVLLSPERRYAIINGEIVPLGGSIAGAELIAIAEERVTLRTADGLRVIQLFPNVKRLETAKSAGATDAAPDASKKSNINKRANPGATQ